MRNYITHCLTHLKLIDKSGSNHSPSIIFSNRQFQILSTFLLTLLFGSSLLRTSSYLPPCNDQRFYEEVFTGRRFLTPGAIHSVQFDAEQPFLRDDALYCDRSHRRTDLCIGRGDVRVVGGGGHGGDNNSYEVVVFAEGGLEREERVKPYTRKWEESVMKTIDEVKVLRKVKGSTAAEASDLAEDPLATAVAQPQDQVALANDNESVLPICDVQHEVPAILFSTGGYTGHVYHEFNDGLIPLFITAQQYPAGQVVLVLLEYHAWWMSKYAEIVSQITNYTVIDLAHDKRVHCFPEVTIGLRIDDELTILDHLKGPAGASMQAFQSMLQAAYLPRLQNESTQSATTSPKLVIISRSSPRALLNQQEVIAMAEEIGFSVQVLSPTPSTEMVDIYKALSKCDVMLGVHGAAMTHLLFMRPGATFIQVVPLGTEWAAATYYGEPAQKLGLNYVEYKVSPRESSLWGKYRSDDPVLVSPEFVNEKGWWETKRIYLEGQDVTVSLPKMGAILRSAYARAALPSS